MKQLVAVIPAYARLGRRARVGYRISGGWWTQILAARWVRWLRERWRVAGKMLNGIGIGIPGGSASLSGENVGSGGAR